MPPVFTERRGVCNLFVALALITFAPATASDVTATRLDGTALVGELRIWERGHVVIATPDGEVRLVTDDLLSLAWHPPLPRQNPNANSTSAEIELTDGSLIPIDELTIAAAMATATLSAPLPSHEKTLTLARTQLAAVRLQPLGGTAAEQWQEIHNADSAGDVLVLLKRDGKSLDYVEGVLGDVASNKIEFKLDGDPLRIDREKVAGFIYYRPNDRAAGEPRCIVHARSGLRAIVSRATMADGLVKIKTISGAAFKWPVHDIHLADFSAGKLIYLSDIEPTSERWTPLVGLPADAHLVAEYGRPRRNQSAYGGPLTLRPDDAHSTSPGNRRRAFSKGLALRSRTELVYRLPAGFRRFATIAGIDPSTTTSGNVRLEIYGDERLLVEDNIAGREPPRSIELDIAGIKRLKILVDYGRNLDTGDWLNLCDARIVK
jgi:hypothetical protein